MNATTAPAAAQPQGDAQRASLSSARGWFAANGLTRSAEHRLLGGVSAGLAHRYGVDRFVMRLAMLVGVLALSPLIYAGLWVLMPSDT